MVNIFVILFLAIISTEDCTFGSLSKGALSWGVDSHHIPISLSTTNSNDGTETIQGFINIFQRFNNTVEICFQVKSIVCVLSPKIINSIQNNCTYGPLSNGATIWVFNHQHKRIALFGSNDGNMSIIIFNTIYMKYNNTANICFTPKRITC